MHKQAKKIIPLLVIIILLSASGSVAFGASQVSGNVPATASKPAGLNYIPFVEITTAIPAKQDVSYPVDQNVVQGKPGVKTKVGPLDQGYLRLAVKNISEETVSIGIYRNEACTDKVEETSVFTDKVGFMFDGDGSVGVAITQPGTEYWVAIYTDPDPGDPVKTLTADQTVKAQVQYFCGEVKNPMIAGKPYYVGHFESPQTAYFTYKAPQTGYVVFDMMAGKGTVTLTDSNQNAISNDVILDVYSAKDFNTVFGVKKGVTYKFHVLQEATPGETEGIYGAKVLCKAAASVGGSTKAKAKALAKKKTIKGAIVAGSNKAHWYKFKFTSNKKTTLRLKANTNKTLKITVTLQKGKRKQTKTFTFTKNPDNYYTHGMTGFKGYTCYIKIAGADKQSSGWYSLHRDK